MNPSDPPRDLPPSQAALAPGPQAPSDDLDDLPELGEEAVVEESSELEALEELGAEAQVGDSAEAFDNAAGDALGAGAADGEPVGDDADSAAVDPSSYRQLYETRLRGMPKDLRVEQAHSASGDLLCALCLDPEPAVVLAVMQNAEVSLVHARLIADHHRNPVGLDALGRRMDLLRDTGVRRLLMRNIQASDPLLKKVLSPMALQQLFRSNMGHENSERARRVGREVLREKFQRTSAEDRVALIVRTEGRCLGLLTGVTFDQKTTALLCSRTYQSSLLVQSLARFPATPPTLVAALLKQALVQRSPHLKKLLLQHKNCPSALKR